MRLTAPDSSNFGFASLRIGPRSQEGRQIQQRLGWEQPLAAKLTEMLHLFVFNVSAHVCIQKHRSR
ncbi:hypothetical protein WG66_016092, partial [Moniliophthora roreri]